MSADVDAAKYVSFVTYKKDGTPVATPVWVVPYDGGYAFTTDPTAYKVRRIKNDARATLTVCNSRGKIVEGATTHIGSALLLDDTHRRETSGCVLSREEDSWQGNHSWRRSNQGDAAQLTLRVNR